MTRDHTYRTEAIILRRTDFGEADRLLTLYSREFGKIRAIAKGVRKPQSRKTGHVELFMRTNFFISEGRDLDIITQAEVVETYSPLRQDLIHTTYASYFVELLDRFTPDADKHLALYNLLKDALSWLCTPEDVRLVARYYELHLLNHVGYQPQLFNCVISGKPIQEQDQFFNAELGGLISPGHETNDRFTRPITNVTIKVLRHLQTYRWETVRGLQLQPSLHRELETVILFYLTHILERNLKSVDFLHRLRQEAALFISPIPSTTSH